MHSTSLTACYAEFIVFNVLSTTHGVEFATFFVEEYPHLFQCFCVREIVRHGAMYLYSPCECMASCTSMGYKEKPFSNTEIKMQNVN